MKKIRFLSCLFFTLSFGLSSSVLANPNWTIEKLMQQFKDTKQVEYQYREVKKVGFLSKMLESRGVLLYKAPDFLEKKVTHPTQDLYRITGSKLEMKKQGKERREVVLTNFPELLALADSMRATFSGNVATLKKYYELELKGNELNWKLLLHPTDIDLKEKVEYIDIQGAKNKIKRILIKEMDGDESILTIVKQ
jgi:hypothetical protein